MRTFYNNTFKGAHPVGASAVVVAESKVEAAKMLSTVLGSRGMAQDVCASSMVEINQYDKSVIILQDGDY
jgi:hypothetical protein